MKKLWQYAIIAFLLASPFFEANAVDYSCPTNANLTGKGWGRRFCVIGKEEKEMCFRCSENLSQEQIKYRCSEAFPKVCAKRCDSDLLAKCKRGCRDYATCKKDCAAPCREDCDKSCKQDCEKGCCEKNCKGNCEGSCKENCEKDCKGYCNETCNGKCNPPCAVKCQQQLKDCQQECDGHYKENCVECTVTTPSAWHGDC